MELSAYLPLHGPDQHALSLIVRTGKRSGLAVG